MVTEEGKNHQDKRTLCNLRTWELRHCARLRVSPNLLFSLVTISPPEDELEVSQERMNSLKAMILQLYCLFLPKNTYLVSLGEVQCPLLRHAKSPC